MVEPKQTPGLIGMGVTPPPPPPSVGKPANEETAKMAGELAVQGAETLRYNGYKVPLVRNLVKRAIRGEAEWATS